MYISSHMAYFRALWRDPKPFEDGQGQPKSIPRSIYFTIVPITFNRMDASAKHSKLKHLNSCLLLWYVVVTRKIYRLRYASSFFLELVDRVSSLSAAAAAVSAAAACWLL